MDELRQRRVARVGMIGSVAAAFAASICCIGPILAVSFGATTLIALAKYEPLRPLFGIGTTLLLGVAFVAAYRKSDASRCETGSTCETYGDRARNVTRVSVWIAAVVAVVLFTFPTWSAWVLG